MVAAGWTLFVLNVSLARAQEQEKEPSAVTRGSQRAACGGRLQLHGRPGKQRILACTQRACERCPIRCSDS